MKTLRGYSYRLNPTDEQAATFRQWAGVCRLVYNAALEQRARWGKSHKLNFYTQAAEMKHLRAEFAWIKDVPSMAQNQALMDLDKAFKNFFAGRASFPTPRRKGINESFRFDKSVIVVRKLNKRWSEIRLPKIGWVKYRDSRPIVGEIRNVTIRLTPLGWHVSFIAQSEIEIPAPLSAEVGIDRGVAVPVMLSTGEAHALPETLAALDCQARRAQKTLSRRKKGSNRYELARKRLAAAKAKAARVRSHWQHELTKSVAERFGVVVMEKLQTKDMTRSAKGTAEEPGKNVKQKAGLNRSILNVGWNGLELKLAYKLQERGGELIFVNPAFTSQTCAQCGHIDKENRESQARFLCVACGHDANADHNAAINILRRSAAFTRMEDGCKPVKEVRTKKQIKLF